MDSEEIANHVEYLREARAGWLDLLRRNPDSITAPEEILSINTKIQFLVSL